MLQARRDKLLRKGFMHAPWESFLSAGYEDRGCGQHTLFTFSSCRFMLLFPPLFLGSHCRAMERQPHAFAACKAKNKVVRSKYLLVLHSIVSMAWCRWPGVDKIYCEPLQQSQRRHLYLPFMLRSCCLVYMIRARPCILALKTGHW